MAADDVEVVLPGDRVPLVSTEARDVGPGLYVQEEEGKAVVVVTIAGVLKKEGRKTWVDYSAKRVSPYDMILHLTYCFVCTNVCSSMFQCKVSVWWVWSELQGSITGWTLERQWMPFCQNYPLKEQQRGINPTSRFLLNCLWRSLFL